MKELNVKTVNMEAEAFEEVRKAFTAKVAKYVANGYQFCLETMGSNQGEIAHTDLLKGDEVLKVMILHDSKMVKNGCEDFYVLQVGFISKSEVFKGWPTIWNQDLEIIEETRYLHKGQYVYAVEE